MKNLVERFLKAYAAQQKDELAALIMPDTILTSAMLGNAKGKHILPLLSLPKKAWTTSTITITNYLEEHDHCVATFHHLCAIEEKNIFYPFLYGGKLYLQGNKHQIHKIAIDLEYEYGNTYVVKGHWKLYEECKHIRYVPTDCFSHDSYGISEVIYKCFLAMDLLAIDLFKGCVTNDIVIVRAGVNQDAYELVGIDNSEDFLRKDKAYFNQNQYSLHLHEIKELDERTIKVTAWHLSPGKPGNKQLAAHTKFTQFFNETIVLLLVKQGTIYKIKSIQFLRKETPRCYGYDVLTL